MERLNGWSTCYDVRKALENVEGNTISEYKNATIIVTGANTGIGKKTAQQLSYLGATVVLACRSKEKADKAIQDIVNDPETEKELRKLGSSLKASDLKLISLVLDLGSLACVSAFAKEFKRESSAKNWPRLKCLVLNAGVVCFDGYHETKEGFELTFGVNHLGHFLLTRLLLPELRSNVPCRVVVVSSESHRGPCATKNVTNEIELMSEVVKPNSQGFGQIRAFKAYGNSKLCNVLFANKLQQLEGSKGISACSLHPGTFINTSVSRGSSVFTFLSNYVFSWFTKTIDQGSATTLFCVLTPSSVIEGKYFDHCQPVKTSRLVSQEAAEILWNLSEKLCSQRSFL